MPRHSPSLLARARNLERLRQISEVAVRHGFGYMFNLRPRLGRRVPEPTLGQRGRHLREMLEELGPTFIKFGQLLSTRPDIVPADIITELVKLQDQVPPFAFEMVREVVEEDLGLTLERLFVEFEPVPVATASIGQVHGAVLPDGQRVMVKVQQPSARQQISRDVELLYQVADLLREHWGERLIVDPVAVVDEFSRSITREIDYILEGRNMDRFGTNFRGHTDVRIPKVHWRYTSRRVLTMERLDGTTLNLLDFEQLSVFERRTLAETITRCWFKQILEDGFFHADPHPANILFMSPSTIGLLDFGMTGSLSEDDLEEGTRLFADILDQDIQSVKRRLRHLGVKWDRKGDEEMTARLEEAFGRYFGASLGELDPAVVLHEIFDIVYQLHVKLPTRYLLLDKSLLTIEGVVTTLFPDFNVFDVARPYAGRLLRRRYRPDVAAERATRRLRSYQEILGEYPYQLHDLLEELRDGELNIKFMHVGLENFSHKLDLITNRMILAILAVALGAIGTTIILFVDTGPQIFGMSLFGLPGVLIALFFGAWLMWAIVRSGRV